VRPTVAIRSDRGDECRLQRRIDRTAISHLRSKDVLKQFNQPTFGNQKADDGVADRRACAVGHDDNRRRAAA
jgi:hypothetical protein